MERHDSGLLRRNKMKLVLLAMNCIMASGAAVVMYVGIYLRHAGWLDLAQLYWSGADAAETALIVVSAVIIGLAVVGSIAAFFRWMSGHCVYAIIVLLLFLLFAFVGVFAFILLADFDDWGDELYPDNSFEKTIKGAFDEVYCYTQEENVCNEASTVDALTMFSPKVNASVMTSFQNVAGGVSSLCTEYSSAYSELTELCDKCSSSGEFELYTQVISDWVEDECPITNQTLVYCGSYVIHGSSSNITVGSSPYVQCRNEILNVFEDYSLYLGIGCILVCLGALMIIISVYCYRRREQLRSSDTEQDDTILSPSNELLYKEVKTP